MKRLPACLTALCALLAGCGGNGSSATNGGAKTVMTEAQFAEVRTNCALGDAKLTNSNSTTTSTDENGVTSTVTIEYDGPPDEKMIVLPESMGQGEVAQAILCLKGEFERLGAEARLSAPGAF